MSIYRRILSYSFFVQKEKKNSSINLQLPALICNGVTLVVSPLVSLIQDQIMHLLQVKGCFVSFYLFLDDFLIAHVLFITGKYFCSLP